MGDGMTCNCDLRTKLVGDGCEECNPKLALEYAKETIKDLEALLRQALEALDELMYAHTDKSERLCAAAVWAIKERLK